MINEYILTRGYK